MPLFLETGAHSCALPSGRVFAFTLPFEIDWLYNLRPSEHEHVTHFLWQLSLTGRGQVGVESVVRAYNILQHWAGEINKLKLGEIKAWEGGDAFPIVGEHKHLVAVEIHRKRDVDAPQSFMLREESSRTDPCHTHEVSLSGLQASWPDKYFKADYEWVKDEDLETLLRGPQSGVPDHVPRPPSSWAKSQRLTGDGVEQDKSQRSNGSLTPVNFLSPRPLQPEVNTESNLSSSSRSSSPAVAVAATVVADEDQRDSDDLVHYQDSGQHRHKESPKTEEPSTSWNPPNLWALPQPGPDGFIPG